MVNKNNVVRVGGIEPPSRPWQGRIIPLNYTRNVSYDISQTLIFQEIRIVFESVGHTFWPLSCPYPHFRALFINKTVDNYGDMCIKDVFYVKWLAFR